MTPDVLAALDEQADRFLARAHADDRVPWRVRLEAWLLMPVPGGEDYRLAAARVRASGGQWSRVGRLGRHRLAVSAMRRGPVA